MPLANNIVSLAYPLITFLKMVLCNLTKITLLLFPFWINLRYVYFNFIIVILIILKVFGHHSNADIASQIIDSGTLLDTLLSMQPRIVSGTGESRESKVLALINGILFHSPFFYFNCL